MKKILFRGVDFCCIRSPALIQCTVVGIHLTPELRFTMAQTVQTVSAADAREAEVKKVQTSADETNKARTGKGTRVRVGQTRGKNPQVITWEAFDDSKPETLPLTLAEFMEIAKVNDEGTILSFVIDGFNSAQYTAASDPIAEFVDPTWNDEIQRQFRLVVRNYSNATGVSIEDAVALIKPGIQASQKKA